MSILIGSDPEFFIKKKPHNTPLPVCGLIGGDKKMARNIGGIDVLEDGTAAEFNPKPTGCSEQWRRMHKFAPALICAKIREERGLLVVPHRECGVWWNKATVKEMPEGAMEIGCDPDFHPFQGGGVIARPRPSAGFRFAGGHVHISWGDAPRVDEEEQIKAALWAESLLGSYACLHDTSPMAVRRLKQYGQPGSFRPKSYGVEYRGLSNFWLWDESHASNVFKLAYKVAEYMQEGRSPLPEKYILSLRKSESRAAKTLEKWGGL